MASMCCTMPSSSPHGSGMLQGRHSAVKDPLAAALRRATAAERQAAAADEAIAALTGESVALAQHNQWLVRQLAEANAARAEAEQRLRAAKLEPAAGMDGGGATAQQPEGALEQVGGHVPSLVQLHLACTLKSHYVQPCLQWCIPGRPVRHAAAERGCCPFANLL